MNFELKVIQKYINPLKYPKLSLFIVLALGFMLRVLKIMNAGIWTDEGIYFYEARIILEGEVPYRDFFKPKPLGMIYILSILFYFLGESVVMARILTSLVGLLTSFFIYLLGKEMYNHKIGFLASILYTFDPLVILFSSHVYMETYSTIFLTLSAYFSVIGKKRDDIIYYFVSGVLIGLAVFMKQPSIIMVFVVVPFILYSSSQKEPLQRKFLCSAIFIIGVVFVFALMFMYYFSIGLLVEYLYYNYTYHTQYVGSTASLWTRIDLVGILVRDNIILWAAGALAIPIFLKNRRDIDVLTLSFFFITSIVLFSLLKQHDHYFVQVIPPLCILASYFLNTVLETIFKLKIIILERYFLLAPLLMLVIVSISLSARAYVHSGHDHGLLEEQKTVADYIKQNTSPEEYIFSSYPAYYFLSERKCPSRYIYLATSTLEAENVDFPEVLQVKKVRYVILTSAFINKRHHEKVDLIISYIEVNYHVEKTFSFQNEEILIYKSAF